MKYPANFWFCIVVPWGRYPVRLWRCKPEHGDYSTDLAFVLAKIGKDAENLCSAEMKSGMC